MNPYKGYKIVIRKGQDPWVIEVRDDENQLVSSMRRSSGWEADKRWESDKEWASSIAKGLGKWMGIETIEISG